MKALRDGPHRTKNSLSSLQTPSPILFQFLNDYCIVKMMSCFSEALTVTVPGLKYCVNLPNEDWEGRKQVMS